MSNRWFFSRFPELSIDYYLCILLMVYHVLRSDSSPPFKCGVIAVIGHFHDEGLNDNHAAERLAQPTLTGFAPLPSLSKGSPDALLFQQPTPSTDPPTAEPATTQLASSRFNRILHKTQAYRPTPTDFLQRTLAVRSLCPSKISRLMVSCLWFSSLRDVATTVLRQCSPQSIRRYERFPPLPPPPPVIAKSVSGRYGASIYATP